MNIRRGNPITIRMGNNGVTIGAAVIIVYQIIVGIKNEDAGLHIVLGVPCDIIPSVGRIQGNKVGVI
jgi:hypothetical protein